MSVSPLQNFAARAVMKQAFGGAFFNLSGVDRACRLLGRPIYTGDQDWTLLQAVHCVDWEDFDQETKVDLLRTCARVMGVRFEEITEAVALLQLGDGA